MANIPNVIEAYKALPGEEVLFALTPTVPGAFSWQGQYVLACAASPRELVANLAPYVEANMEFTPGMVETLVEEIWVVLHRGASEAWQVHMAVKASNGEQMPFVLQVGYPELGN